MQRYSPYDGATWTDPTDVDIDHMVPLVRVSFDAPPFDTSKLTTHAERSVDLGRVGLERQYEGGVCQRVSTFPPSPPGHIHLQVSDTRPASRVPSSSP